MNIVYTLRTANQEDAQTLFDIKTIAMEPVASKSKSTLDRIEEYQKFLKEFEPEKIQVIEVENKPIGRLRVVRSAESIYVGGIQILPEYQGQGIGTAIFNTLIEKAQQANKPITLEVHHVNEKAIVFYQKLGFKEVGKTETQILLEFNISK